MSLADAIVLSLIAGVILIPWIRARHKENEKVDEEPEPLVKIVARPKSVQEELLSRKWFRPLCIVEIEGHPIVAVHCVCGNMHRNQEDFVLAKTPAGFILGHESCLLNHDPIRNP